MKRGKIFREGGLYLSVLFIVISICLISANGITNSSCIPNWNCTEWSKCIDGNKIRSCIDFNLCGDNSTKPDEIQECTTDCIPVWNCSKWQPEKCSKEDETQTRVCNDLNDCGLDEKKPSETRTCKRDSLLLFIILIIIIITTSIIVVITIIEKITKKSIIELLTKKKDDGNKDIKRPFQYKDIKQPSSIAL